MHWSLLLNYLCKRGSMVLGNEGKRILSLLHILLSEKTCLANKQALKEVLNSIEEGSFCPIRQNRDIAANTPNGCRHYQRRIVSDVKQSVQIFYKPQSNLGQVSKVPHESVLLKCNSQRWLHSGNIYGLSSVNFKEKTNLRGKLFSKQVMPKNTSTVQEDVEESWGGPEAYKLIHFVGEKLNEFLEKNPAVLMFFSANWCRHCLRLRRPYGKAALMAKEANLEVIFAVFDITIDPELADDHGIIGIPIINYYKNGKFVSIYKGKRTAESLFEFAKVPPNSPETRMADI